jgi:hypothetical protein
MTESPASTARDGCSSNRQRKRLPGTDSVAS